jgi:hypothetical protein
MTEAPHLPHPNGSVGVDIRPTLLRAMIDLYVQKQTHTEQEEQHFTKLALRLIDLVEPRHASSSPARSQAIQRRLLPCANGC